MDKSLPLIDVQFGLSQLGGNQVLFNRMLTKFKQSFSETPESVLQNVDNEQFDEAKIAVHTTKGISGNLGLTALFECSKTLDKQIKDKAIDPDVLNSFSEIMAQTCQAITEHEANTSEHAEQEVPENNDDTTAVLLEKLQRHEFIDDDELQRLVGGLNLTPEQRIEVINLIEELQYEKAIDIIKGQ